MATPSVAFFEITGKDRAALQRYYRDLFGWQIQDAGEAAPGYGLVAAAEKGIGGGIGTSRWAFSHVTVYVEVDDVAAYLDRAERLGGRTLVPPTENARFGLTIALFADPEGHVVGLARGLFTGAFGY